MYIQTQRRRALLQSGAIAQSVLAFISGCILGALLLKLARASAPDLVARFGASAMEAAPLSFPAAFSLCVKFPLLCWLLLFWRRGSAGTMLVLLFRGALASFFLGCLSTAVRGGYLAGLVMLFFHCCAILPLLLFFSALAGSIGRTDVFWRQPGRWKAAMLLLAVVLLASLVCALGEWQLRPRMLAWMESLLQ